MSNAPATGVVTELVGYALEAQDDRRPLVLGRGSDADVRLHNAPVARRAALLLPPHEGRPFWAVVPAGPGLTLRLDSSPRPGGTRVRETSFRPWAEKGGTGGVTVGCDSPRATVTPVRLHQLRLRGRESDSLAEPEIHWLAAGGRVAVGGEEAAVDVVSCPTGRVFWKPRDASPAQDPCAAKAEGWKRAGRCWIGRPAVCLEPFARSWGVRVSQGTGSWLRTPWSEPFHDRGLSVLMSGPGLRSVRLGIDASGPDPDCDGAGCEPAVLPVCPSGSPEVVETLGPLNLRNGDVLAVGGTRFVVLTDESPEASLPQRLAFVHVRQPRAPGYFQASSGHDVYHPNRRALWTVPSCDAREDALTLVVQPADGSARNDVTPAAFPDRDRELLNRIDAAAANHGVPHEIPAVVPHGVGERALLTLCAERGEKRKLAVRLTTDTPRDVLLRTPGNGPGQWLSRGEIVSVPLGSARNPEEVLVTMDGNLMRIAPAAAPRVTRRTRLGLAGFLIFVLVLQALALNRARAEARRSAGGAERTAWPAEFGPPTLQQLAGIGIAVLLFVGASFQLFLALHPELAGKPDYAQAFLQGAVAVATVLLAAAGFAAGGGDAPRRSAGPVRLSWRLSGAALGASLALLGGAVWWWWDGWGVPRELWLTALRDRATAATATGPSAFAQLLLYGGAASLFMAAVFFAAGLLPWPRLVEQVGRLGLRAPVLGFVVPAAAGLGLGLLQRSALAFELGILAGLSWYAAVYWAFVRRGRLLHEEGLKRRAAVYSLGSGLVMLGFLILFFLIGAELPDAVSFLFVILGLGILARCVSIMVAERFTSLLRVLALWAAAAAFGSGFASLVLTDMGSIAAWIPAVLAGLFLWLVRPEEQGSRAEEPRKARSHLLLAVGSGLLLLGVLDVFKTAVQGLEWQALDRPRQRLDLAEDVSYITAGEWITQVRWLASQQDGDFRWVPNVNSDVAVFGLASGVGSWLAVLASVLLLGVAGCAALAADQALREGHALASRADSDRLYPVLHRGLGLLTGMVAVFLIAQWLVHLATGVVLHLPITGLAFPFVSHGNTTHLLFAGALVVPMAALTALGRHGAAQGSR